MIEESKILEFINKNDNRRGNRLEKYREVILRLLNEKVKKKDIYEFIKSEDDDIGSLVYFYKFVSKIENKNSSRNQNKSEESQNNKKASKTSNKTNKSSIVARNASIENNKKSNILSSKFDLMDY